MMNSDARLRLRGRGVPTLLLALTAALLLSACGEDASPDVRNNTLKAIQPYYSSGTWIFDDAATGLRAEPFVHGIPEMIDRLVADIPNARAGFRLTFSATPFPGHTLRLERAEAYGGGNFYLDPATGRRGWLCPALFKYFHVAPDAIYIQADAIPN